MKSLSILALATLPLPVFAQESPSHAPSPYADQQGREIAALSAEDVEGLLAGRGMSYALSAELNGYPGPAHLLDMVDALALDEAQKAAIADARDRMTAEAQALGARLMEAERALDAAFEAGDLDRAGLAALTAEAARLGSELRTVHLAAHLEVTPLLTPHQVAAYGRLRGYGATASHEQ